MRHSLKFNTTLATDHLTTEAIKDYGTVNSDGRYSVAYGILFDKTANTRKDLMPGACANVILTDGRSLGQWKR